jgi:hypothetical protein
MAVAHKMLPYCLHNMRTDKLEVLMPLQMAFGITVRDVRAVLVKHADKIVGRSGMSDEALAASLYYSFSEEEMDDIALAAMDAFLDDKPEVDGAHRAIRKLLIRRGVLDVSRRAPSRQTARTNASSAAISAAMAH